jgi:hypothetical protein
MGKSSIVWIAEPLADDLRAAHRLVLDEASECAYCFAADSVAAYPLPWTKAHTQARAALWQVSGDHVPRSPVQGLARSSLAWPVPAAMSDIEQTVNTGDRTPRVLATMQADSSIHLLDVASAQPLPQVPSLPHGPLQMPTGI